MNRWISTDSKLSLDLVVRPRHAADMMNEAYDIYTERENRALNMARFYAMSIEQDLFGGVALVRRWGRIGTTGKALVQHFTDEEDAAQCFRALLRRKQTRGYRPRI